MNCLLELLYKRHLDMVLLNEKQVLLIERSIEYIKIFPKIRQSSTLPL